MIEDNFRVKNVNIIVNLDIVEKFNLVHYWFWVEKNLVNIGRNLNHWSNQNDQACT